jgi:hypothetical protein
VFLLGVLYDVHLYFTSLLHPPPQKLSETSSKHLLPMILNPYFRYIIIIIIIISSSSSSSIHYLIDVNVNAFLLFIFNI